MIALYPVAMLKNQGLVYTQNYLRRGAVCPFCQSALQFLASAEKRLVGVACLSCDLGCSMRMRSNWGTMSLEQEMAYARYQSLCRDWRLQRAHALQPILDMLTLERL